MTDHSSPAVALSQTLAGSRSAARRARINRRVIFPLLKQVPIWISLIMTLFPIYFVVMTALKTQDEYVSNKLSPSAVPTLANFVTVFSQPNFGMWFRNSLIIALSVSLISVIIGTLGAFAFSQMQFPGRRALLQGLLSMMVFPTIVLAIPLFVVFARLHLINRLPSAIAIYLGVTAPFTLLVLTGFFRTVPGEILDAAKVDGCTQLQLMRHILMPLTVPALITVAIVNANYVWNELLIAVIFLQVDKSRTLMSGLAAFGRFGVLDVPYVMAGLVVATLPMVVVYVIGQQYFIRGLTAGALKG
jgi:ABC-type glycerol-3-phosphate transport system permease component